jgi:branched-chain amino acid transport system permease protein
LEALTGAIQLVNLVLAGLFHASLLFLVSAGLQIVFGVQKIVNLACGAIYAMGAYFGITVGGLALGAGLPSWLLVPILICSGLALAAVLGPVLEFALRAIYDRDEHFQLLLTFAMVLMLEDVIRFFWGTGPRQLGNSYLTYGVLEIGAGIAVPVYNFIVMACALAIALGTNWLTSATRLGVIIRATAENRRMSEAMAIPVGRVYTAVFTLGTALGTVGGALAIPASAASLDMAIELIVDAFAVVIIGGLGSMKGALYGALIVGLVKAAAVATYPELEMLAIYAIVIGVLLLAPGGLVRRAA